MHGENLKLSHLLLFHELLRVNLRV